MSYPRKIILSPLQSPSQEIRLDNLGFPPKTRPCAVFWMMEQHRKSQAHSGYDAKRLLELSPKERGAPFTSAAVGRIRKHASGKRTLTQFHESVRAEMNQGRDEPTASWWDVERGYDQYLIVICRSYRGRSFLVQIETSATTTLVSFDDSTRKGASHLGSDLQGTAHHDKRCVCLSWERKIGGDAAAVNHFYPIDPSTYCW